MALLIANTTPSNKVTQSIPNRLKRFISKLSQKLSRFLSQTLCEDNIVPRVNVGNLTCTYLSDRMPSLFRKKYTPNIQAVRNVMTQTSLDTNNLYRVWPCQQRVLVISGNHKKNFWLEATP